MKLSDAKKLLERVVEKKQAIAYRHYKKEVPHRRQLTEPWFAGRFPQKAAGRLLRLLEELEANAEYRNLDTERLKIIHAAAQRANAAMLSECCGEAVVRCVAPVIGCGLVTSSSYK